MQHGSTYQQKKDEILKLIKEATPKQIEPPQMPQPSASRGLIQKTLPYLVIVCLVGTMIPVDQANAFFGVCAAIGLAALLVLWLSRKNAMQGHTRAFVALFVAGSLLSGCSGKLFSSENLDVLNLCEGAKECRVGVANGISVLGYPISRADVETARLNGGIETVRAAEVTKGYGLISLTQVKVWGDAQEG